MKSLKGRHSSRDTKFCVTTIKKIKKHLSPQAIANLAAQGAENKKAEDIEILDVRKNSQICDYFVICSATSTPHFRAIADEIDKIVEKNNINAPHWQGDAKSNWIILDLFDVIVHIIGFKERSLYKLEDLWAKSGVIYHF